MKVSGSIVFAAQFNVAGRRRATAVPLSLFLLFYFCTGLVGAQETSSLPGSSMPGSSIISSLTGVFQGGPLFGCGSRCPGQASLAAYGGLLVENGGHLHHEIETSGATVHGTRHARFVYPQSGFWLGASGTVPAGNRLQLIAEGWKLLPIEAKATSGYVDATNPADIQDNGGVARIWNTKTDGWFLDGALAVAPWGDGSLSGSRAVIGSRYDYYRKVLSQKETKVNMGFGSDDELDVTVKMFVPYVGVQVQVENPLISGRLRMLGSPVLIGSLTHAETWGGLGLRDHASFPFMVPKGYWAELFWDFDVRVLGDSSIGGFLKMTTMTALSDANIESVHIGGGSQSARYEMVYRNLRYLVGLKLSMRF